MHYLQKQLLEEEKKKAKLNAGHCKTEGKKKTKLNAGHCKTESELNEQAPNLPSWSAIVQYIQAQIAQGGAGQPQDDFALSMYDYDGDGTISFNDLTIALSLWGQGIMPATAQQYQAGQLMYDDSGLGDSESGPSLIDPKIPQRPRSPRPTPRPLPQRFPKPAIGQIPEGYELDEQRRGRYDFPKNIPQKYNLAKAKKVFEKHWREMERKLVNDLVRPYEGRGPVNYDLTSERHASDYFESNTEDLLNNISQRFEDLNAQYED